jgi:transposase InsO family protein
MSKARVVITAVVVEGRSQAEVARAYGVSKGWVSKLVARYRAEGEAAYEPRSRRPRSSPKAIALGTVELIIGLRKELTEQGLDAGPDTIAWHLHRHHQITVSVATISRYLTAHGMVTPAPKKRPRSSYIRFQAALPNECWQSDFTHYRLTDGTPDGADVEVLSWLDDHSRYALHVTCWRAVTGAIVVESFRQAVRAHGVPASTLTDNGMVFTTRFSGGKSGRNGLETELRRLHIVQKNSRPNHPTTCGKVERFQQTLKKWLTAQPVQPANLEELQALIDAFVEAYNHSRPHRSLPHRATPATTYHARPKAGPTADRSTDVHYRVLADKVDLNGKLSLRLNGRMHHIGIGTEHARTQVLKLVDDLHVRIVNAATGELLRELTIDPTRDYQPLGRPPGPKPKNRKPNPSPGFGLSGIS